LCALQNCILLSETFLYCSW